MKLLNIKRLIIAFSLLSLTDAEYLSVKAQGGSEEQYFHRLLYTQTSFDFKSAVASDMVYSTKMEFSDISVKYKGEYGTFHRTQAGKNITGYMFDAEGAVNPSEKTYMSGGFHFSQNYKNSVSYSSIINPYRGTPYQLADSTDSNWRIQNYSMWTKLATELVEDKLSAGVFLSLDVARGAKMIDPRPKSNNNRIEAAPSLTLNLGKSRVGASFIYERLNEQTNFILYNSSESQKIFAFKGLGQYTFDIFSTTERERSYDGYGVGCAVSYRYKKDNFEMNLLGKYNNYGEEVSDIEYSKPRLRGKYFSDKYEGFANLKLSAGCLIHQFILRTKTIKESGKEIIQIFNSSEDVNAWQTDSEAPNRWKGDKKGFSAIYSLKTLNATGYYSPYGVEIRYNNNSFDESYRVMDTYIDYKNNVFSLTPELNRPLGNNILTTLKIKGEYCIVSDFNSNYKERELDNHTVKNGFFDKETEILSQNYYSLGAMIGAGYSFENGNALMVNVNYSYLKSDNGLYRHYPLISLSYNF
jgi:hypothetical protein